MLTAEAAFTQTAVPGVNPVLRALKQQLEPGERILWSQQPLAGRSARSILFIYLFAIPWTAMSGFMELTAFQHGSLLMAVFGVPFVLAGLAMLAMPYIVYQRALRTLYAITDRRVMVFTRHRGTNLESRPLLAIGEAHDQKIAADGSGSIQFSAMPHSHISYVKLEPGTSADPEALMRLAQAHAPRVIISSGKENFGFEHVPDVRQALDKLRQARAQAEAEAQPHPIIQGV